MDEVNGYTQDEIEELIANERNDYGDLSVPTKKERADIFTFFNNVKETFDTIKVSNLDPAVELFPVRTLREGELTARILGWKLIEDFFHDRSEIILGSALSKEAKFLELAVTTKKESMVGRKERRENSGWFKKREA